MTLILKSLHWLPVKQRILFKVLLLVYKCKNDLAPEYLRCLCKPYKQDYNSRSNKLDLLDRPSTKTKKSYGDRAFSVAGPEEWNRLPLDLKHSPSLETFKSKLKTRLYQQCFSWVFLCVTGLCLLLFLYVLNLKLWYFFIFQSFNMWYLS